MGRTERSMHTCGKMIVNGKIRIVVAGGWNDTQYLDSVEILDPNTLGKGWVPGPSLPYGLSGSSMVCSPQGDGVIVIGGWNSEIGRDSVDVLELKNNSKEWKMLETKLQFGRRFHVALPISIEICQNFKKKVLKSHLEYQIVQIMIQIWTYYQETTIQKSVSANNLFTYLI